LAPIPNPQSPIPNPQSPFKFQLTFFLQLISIFNIKKIIFSKKNTKLKIKKMNMNINNLIPDTPNILSLINNPLPNNLQTPIPIPSPQNPPIQVDNSNYTYI
jgi:hypothetical protein